MERLSLHLTAVLALLALALLCADAAALRWAARRRRRPGQGGVFGVVVDAAGRVLGVYVDPLSGQRRTARMHGPGSAWTGTDPERPDAWAWEGQAETEEEARHLAQRLRHLHVSLRPELRGLVLPAEESGEEA